MIPIIRCNFGIGNRVATMANALSRSEEIHFQWRINKVLPLTHEEVFPNGIEGVHFFVDGPRGLSTRWERKIYGETWEAAGDREAANQAYNRIMEAMAGEPREAPEIAIIGRFWRFPDADCSSLAQLAAREGSKVFLLTDSRRSELTTILESLGVEVIFPIGNEMDHDLDRTPESTLTYLSDWKTASMAKVIVTHRDDTSVTYPARARGATIIQDSL